MFNNFTPSLIIHFLIVFLCRDRIYYVEQCKAAQCGPPHLRKYMHLLWNKDEPQMTIY